MECLNSLPKPGQFHERLRKYLALWIILVCILTTVISLLVLFYRQKAYLDDLIYTRFIVEGCISDLADIKNNRNFSSTPQHALPECTKKSEALLRYNESYIWIVKSNLHSHYERYLTCCYASFYSINASDATILNKTNTGVQYNKCIYFFDYIEVGKQDEFVKVECFVNEVPLYDKFFIFAPKKPFKLSPANNTNSTYNVIVLGIDAMSRLNLHRMMPKTYSMMKNLDAIEMLGFNGVGFPSFTNALSMLTGMYGYQLMKSCTGLNKTLDNCNFVWNQFEKAGFYTGFLEDRTICDGPLNDFLNSPTDYYTNTFMREVSKYYKSKHRQFSLKCIEDCYPYEIILKYLGDLTKSLQFNRFFGFFWEESFSRNGLNDAIFMDEGYFQLLSTWNSTGYLDNTIVILLGDHTMNFGESIPNQKDRLENRLPPLFFILPKNMKDRYQIAYNNIHENNHRITSAFDLYETLLDLADIENIEDAKIEKSNQQRNRTGTSLFQILPVKRTCKMAGIGIEDESGSCIRKRYLDINSIEAEETSEATIRVINDKLNDSKECAVLRVFKITSCVVIMQPFEEESLFRVQVKFFAEPGHGHFLATYRKDFSSKDDWNLTGSISRLNAYGEKSKCVQDRPDLLEYCFCV